MASSFRVRFALCASADIRELIGDINFWVGRRHPMQRSLCGHWVVWCPGCKRALTINSNCKDPHGEIVCRTKADRWVSMRAVHVICSCSLTRAIPVARCRLADSHGTTSWNCPCPSTSCILPLKRHEDGSSLSYREMAAS
jgi:1,4-alpha-glucan branching enzyme